MNWYAHDKIRELDAELLKNTIYFQPPRSRRRPVLGLFAGAAGRVLLRLGGTLEDWADRPTRDPERPLARRIAR